MRRRVDYRSVAALYQQGRVLAGEDLRRWRAAVVGVVSSEPGIVLDLGAGTGIFTCAWSGWGARHVIACEPSVAMLDQARRHGIPANASLVVGRAEKVPLATESIDVMWLSTVVHHIGDLCAWGAESRRVLVPGGWLLIRNLFSDLGTTPWLAELPGSDRARRAFPSVADLGNLLEGNGFRLVETITVTESQPAVTAQVAAAWIRRMRDADSLLLAFTDEEIAVGLERLESYPQDHALDPGNLGLLALQRLS